MSERAYILQAGQAYIVLDPEFSYLAGQRVERYLTVIFDLDWRALSHLSG